MSIEKRVTLKDGTKWGVGLVMMDHFCGQVIVPITEIEHMSNEEIGANVRSLRRQANRAAAEDHAYNYGRRTVVRLAKDEELLSKLKDVLEPFLGEGGDIDKAWEKIIAAENLRRENAIKRARKRQKRQQISSERDALFAKIGKRDGFKCACCESVDNLEIDHIEPLSKGGTNDPENLQLLCKPCNMEKGTDRIDYR